jgi:hypothetical protein
MMLLLVVMSCTTPQSSETKETTQETDNSVPDSTLDAEELESFNEESHEAVEADTVLLDSIKTVFNKPQFDPRTAYVYAKEGLDVYGGRINSSSVIGDVKYRSKVKLLEDLHAEGTDEIVVDGLKGHSIKIEYEGGAGYVFSGYLTNFPVPGDHIGLVDYFIQNFQLAETPKKITSKVMFDATWPEWWKTVYRFEGDMEFNDRHYYEGASVDIKLPASCSMQDGFLLLKALPHMSDFANAFAEFPPKDFSKTIDEEHRAKVELNDQGEIVKIIFIYDPGCPTETYVEKFEARVVLYSGGGC